MQMRALHWWAKSAPNSNCMTSDLTVALGSGESRSWPRDAVFCRLTSASFLGTSDEPRVYVGKSLSNMNVLDAVSQQLDFDCFTPSLLHP